VKDTLRVRTRRLSLVLLVGLVAGACSWDTRDLEVSCTDNEFQSSFIYAADGTLLTSFQSEEFRINVQAIDEIPQVLLDAVVAVEDERFWEHSGVDLLGTIRAARSNLSTGGVSEGGSTITQQFVGLCGGVDRSERTAARKVEEVALAWQFERQYTKDFILVNYLNEVFFGERARGVIAAAEIYFDKSLDELTLAEAAMIAGLIQAPTSFNPFENPETAAERREQVLQRMLVNELITDKEYDEARTEPLRLADRSQPEEVRYPAGHFVADVRQWFVNNPLFGETFEEREELLLNGGLTIRTTIDLDLQAKAEAAVAEVLADEGPDGPTASVILIENATGYVRAMVAGEDFFGDAADAEFNLATQGGRQAGSAFKPFVLAAALTQGFPMGKTYPAPPVIEIPLPNLPEPWRVKGGGSGAPVTLDQATISSYNTVFAQLMMDVGPENGVAMANNLGVKSELLAVPAAVLGTENVTALDMATAYSTFARRGVLLEPTLVTEIVRADGTILYEHSVDSRRVITADVADQVTQALTGVISRGTGTAAQLADRPAAGKTGTAENAADATFSGFTPQYTASVWVGFPEEQIPMLPPTTLIQVFGGSYPARIWQRVMTAATEGLPVVEFVPPVATSVPTSIPEESVMPDLVGIDIVSARALLEELFLVANVTTFTNTGEDPGTVLNQSPAPGTIVPTEVPVALEVAASGLTPTPGDGPGGRGPGDPSDDDDFQGADPDNLTRVPNVVGLSAGEATSLLRSVGFAVTEIIQPGTGASADLDSGTVWRQEPIGGLEVSNAGQATIFVQP
jgi:penicillin-binding protein 1A